MQGPQEDKSELGLMDIYQASEGGPQSYSWTGLWRDRGAGGCSEELIAFDNRSPYFGDFE